MAQVPKLIDEPEQERELTDDMSWLHSPATVPRFETTESILEAANKYFQGCYKANVQPRLTALALVLGLPGVSSIHRLARRRPELREAISRCITAVAHGYEERITTSGSRGAIFMLQHMADFDTEEEETAPPIPFWQDTQRVLIEQRIAGIQTVDDRGAELSPVEAYVRIIHGQDQVDVLTKKPTHSGQPRVESLAHLLSSIEDGNFRDVSSED